MLQRFVLSVPAPGIAVSAKVAGTALPAPRSISFISIAWARQRRGTVVELARDLISLHSFRLTSAALSGRYCRRVVLLPASAAQVVHDTDTTIGPSSRRYGAGANALFRCRCTSHGCLLACQHHLAQLRRHFTPRVRRLSCSGCGRTPPTGAHKSWRQL